MRNTVLIEEFFWVDPKHNDMRVACKGKPINVIQILALCVLLAGGHVFAQAPQEQPSPSYYVRFFSDLYYGYDFNLPEERLRQPFLYNHNRHNALRLNLGLVSMGLDHPRYRAALSLQIGTYASDNYAEEPELLQNVHDAYVGIVLSSKRNLVFDVGVMPSHIGFESAISSQNYTLTRSLLAENSPYYSSGAQLRYTDEKWELAGLILNGWQRIRIEKKHIRPSFGTQISYTSEQNRVWNWSTFVGSNDADSSRRTRYFSNLYTEQPLGKALRFIAGVDIGIQQKTPGESSFYGWVSPVIMGQYAISSRWKMACRVESYSDPGSVVIEPINTHAFYSQGYSVNIDYELRKQVWLRLEGRFLRSVNPIFASPNGFVSHNYFLATSLSVSIPEW